MTSFALLLLIALQGVAADDLTRDSNPPLDPERLGVWFGYSVARLGDADGDGVVDFAVGSPLEHWHKRSDYAPGRVFGVSGKTAEILYRIEGPTWFGSGLVALDDFDDDGVSELAVLDDRARITVLSGKTGEAVRDYSFGHPTGSPVGTTAASIPDIDGDGIGELIVSGPPGHGIRIYSGSEGHQLLLLQGGAFAGAGASVIGLNDVDGDGAGDLAFTREVPVVEDVDAESPRPADQPSVEIAVVSGKTGEELHSFPVERPSAQFQVEMCALGDLDSDGVDDFAVAAAQDKSPGTFDEVFEPGIVQLHSGRTGHRLRSLAGPDNGVSFGFSIDGSSPEDGGLMLIARYGIDFAGSPSVSSGPSTYWPGRVYGLTPASGELTLRCEERGASARCVVWLGDVNGDAVADYVVGTSPDDAGDWRQGHVSVYSGATDERLYRVPAQ